MLYQLSYVRAAAQVSRFRQFVEGPDGLSRALWQRFWQVGAEWAGSSVRGLPENPGMAEQKPQVEKRSLSATLAAAAVTGVTSGAAGAYVNKGLSKKPKKKKKS